MSFDRTKECVAGKATCGARGVICVGITVAAHCIGRGVAAIGVVGNKLRVVEDIEGFRAKLKIGFERGFECPQERNIEVGTVGIV